jgi:NodT family efflux transporter outer membrane factor (OMF) lipoprotein
MYEIQQSPASVSRGKHGRAGAIARCCTMWAVLAFLATGCSGMQHWWHNEFRVGPEYCRPPAPVADEWIEADNPSVLSETTDYDYWWATFNDPALNELQQMAQEQNLPLQSAGMRILEARAHLAIARGNLWPQLQQAFGAFSRNEISGNLANSPSSLFFDDWNAGFDATWELDIWGRFRHAVESTEANLNAEIENYDDVLVILQGEVAAAYIQLRALQERLELASQNVTLQEESLRIAAEQERKGAVTKADPLQASENLETTRSLIPELENSIRETQNALCVLTGIPPQDLDAVLGEAPTPQAPEAIVVGIPADLLRRRPDVRRAERLAAAQSARIGIAEADFYPRIAISGFIGLESEDFMDLFDSRSGIGSIGPGFRWDILNYGRIHNSVRAEEARFHRLVVDYQNTALEANREVENALSAFLRERQRMGFLANAVRDSVAASELTLTIYKAGKIDLQRVVDTQRTRVLREDSLAESKGLVGIHLVAIYKALGGGWVTRLAPQPPPEMTQAVQPVDQTPPLAPMPPVP